MKKRLCLSFLVLRAKRGGTALAAGGCADCVSCVTFHTNFDIKESCFCFWESHDILPRYFVLILYALRDINDSAVSNRSPDGDIPFSKLFQGSCAVRNLVLFGKAHLCEGFLPNSKDWIIPKPVCSAR